MENENTASASTENQQWFYESNGYQYGPVDKNEIIKLINDRTLTEMNKVWTAGIDDWIALGDSQFAACFEELKKNTPPPLNVTPPTFTMPTQMLGKDPNEILIWVLAAAPTIGMVVESIFSFILWQMRFRSLAENLWWVTIALNIALVLYDEQQLKKSGANMAGMQKWEVCLVPVYLYKRAKILNQQPPIHFIVWIATFVISTIINIAVDALRSHPFY